MNIPSIDEPLVLMERSCGGWRTEMWLHPDSSIEIVAQQGEGSPVQAMFVRLDKALDAYNHPYCYLPVEETQELTSEPLAERLEQYSMRVDAGGSR